MSGTAVSGSLQPQAVEPLLVVLTRTGACRQDGVLATAVLLEEQRAGGQRGSGVGLVSAWRPLRQANDGPPNPGECSLLRLRNNGKALVTSRLYERCASNGGPSASESGLHIHVMLLATIHQCLRSQGFLLVFCTPKVLYFSALIFGINTM